MTRHARIALLPLVALMAADMPAFAQDAPSTPDQGADAAGSGFDEIIVTARRREESLSRVPASIVAISETQLREQGLVSEIDLQRAAPGLTVKEGLSSNQINFAIRGQSVDPFTTSPSAVLPYINEVQITGIGSSAFFDLQSVQVLKGPQGTLFGKNTTGGAVLFETKKPGNELAGYVSGKVGNYNSYQVEGAIDLPIVADTVLLRVGGQYRERDGYIKNLLAKQTIGDNKSTTLRGTLVLKPGDGFRNTTVVNYAKTKGTSSGVLYSVNACGALNLVSATACAYGPANNPFFANYAAANPQFAGGPVTVDGHTFNYG